MGIADKFQSTFLQINANYFTHLWLFFHAFALDCPNFLFPKPVLYIIFATENENNNPVSAILFNFRNF
jgi:hypothetical protein